MNEFMNDFRLWLSEMSGIKAMSLMSIIFDVIIIVILSSFCVGVRNIIHRDKSIFVKLLELTGEKKKKK